MKALRRHIILLVLLGIVAGVAWAGAWYASSAILSLRDAKATTVAAAQKEERARASAALLHSAVAESADVRAKMETLSRADVVSLASTIESTGKATGAKVHVVDVGPLPDKDAQRAAQTGVHTVGYSVEGTGTFPQLMAVVELLETLPAPTIIDQFSLSRATDAATGWRLTMRLRVFTAMNAS